MDFSHVDTEGNAVMVDAGEKAITRREAVAEGRIHMSEACFAALKDGTVKKGAVLNTARVAGIMAAKRTPELIPLCHTLNLSKVRIDISLHAETREAQALCTVCCEGKTGVEMEALTGVTVALLTVYDMCKAVDKKMEMNGIHLVSKTGGKSGFFHYNNDTKKKEQET